MIDLREILETIRGIVANVTLGVTVVGGLVLFSGILILVGAVSMTKFRRVYEAAILKTLGASGRLIATMLLLEYGVLGAIAGTVGSLGAVALSWAVARFALELEWEPAPRLTLDRHRRDRRAGVCGRASWQAGTSCGTSHWRRCAPSSVIKSRFGPARCAAAGMRGTPQGRGELVGNGPGEL